MFSGEKIGIAVSAALLLSGGGVAVERAVDRVRQSDHDLRHNFLQDVLKRGSREGSGDLRLKAADAFTTAPGAVVDSGAGEWLNENLGLGICRVDPITSGGAYGFSVASGWGEVPRVASEGSEISPVEETPTPGGYTRAENWTYFR